MKNNLLENKQDKCLLDIEKLIDHRIREQKILNDCFNILLEENYQPDNSNINLYIRDVCIKLDRELETATLLYREQNGTPYINDKTKEIKRRPIEYKKLNVSLSESQRLAGIYTDKYNEKQIEDRKKALQDFSKNPDLNTFNQYMNELKTLYSFNDKDIMYITHWITNVKRIILDLQVELPQILCFYSHKQYIGKSELASIIAKVLNKRLITTDLYKLSARFKPLTLTTESVLLIDELKKIDKTISDNIKTTITADSIDFELKGKDGRKQYKKMASFIMTTNYDPANIFYEDERQRRIAIIHFNGFTEKKTRDELETLIKNIWDNSPIEYIIDPDVIAEITFNETKENTMLEYFICHRTLNMLSQDRYITKNEIASNLSNYTGGLTKLASFLKNEEYFTRKIKSNGVNLFKATDNFKKTLMELLQGKDEDIDDILYHFERVVA